MYNTINTIADISREIVALEEDKDRLTLYLFEQGETDRDFNLPPQHKENELYMLGYQDRDYQIQIGFTPEPIVFEHF